MINLQLHLNVSYQIISINRSKALPYVCLSDSKYLSIVPPSPWYAQAEVNSSIYFCYKLTSFSSACVILNIPESICTISMYHYCLTILPHFGAIISMLCTCMDKMWNLVISFPGKFCFWREVFAILRENLSVSYKNFWKFVKNSHFWHNFWPYSRHFFPALCM